MAFDGGQQIIGSGAATGAAAEDIVQRPAAAFDLLPALRGRRGCSAARTSTRAAAQDVLQEVLDAGTAGRGLRAALTALTA